MPLPFDSPRWAELKAAAGGTGELAARLLRELDQGDSSGWDELSHQACHQFTVGEVAYAVVPHAIALATNLPLDERVPALELAGMVYVSASGRTAPPVPTDLANDYEAAQRNALVLAVEALAHTAWQPGDSYRLLGVVAAFQGRRNLALHLFLHGGRDDELECPECGETIQFD